jgi:acetoacetate decarboxylase
VQVEFTPERPLENTGQSTGEGLGVLGLRVIPSPVEGERPSVKELVPSQMILKGGETWVGTGSVSFPTQMASHPLHKLEVLRYEATTYISGASAIIYPAQVTFPL